MLEWKRLTLHSATCERLYASIPMALKGLFLLTKPPLKLTSMATGSILLNGLAPTPDLAIYMATIESEPKASSSYSATSKDTFPGLRRSKTNSGPPSSTKLSAHMLGTVTRLSTNNLWIQSKKQMCNLYQVEHSYVGWILSVGSLRVLYQ